MNEFEIARAVAAGEGAVAGYALDVHHAELALLARLLETDADVEELARGLETHDILVLGLADFGPCLAVILTAVIVQADGVRVGHRQHDAPKMAVEPTRADYPLGAQLGYEIPLLAQETDDAYQKQKQLFSHVKKNMVCVRHGG